LDGGAGPGGAYSWLAGREAGRLLAKMAKDTGVHAHTTSFNTDWLLYQLGKGRILCVGDRVHEQGMERIWEEGKEGEREGRTDGQTDGRTESGRESGRRDMGERM
jgi:hypothetical protein